MSTETIAPSLGRDQQVQELLDKTAITELLHRYCRACDRADFEALREIFWEDAVDHHGITDGEPGLLIAWLTETVAKPGSVFEWMIHSVSNILIELHGDQAAVESYFVSTQRRHDDSGTWDDLVSGRYVDRMERRGGEWRIAERSVLYAWSHSLEAQDPMWAGFGDNFLEGTLDRSDPIYSLLERVRSGGS
jgi:3-phenylpropionate/cinnamic acid dioxygenase small subunit